MSKRDPLLAQQQAMSASLVALNSTGKVVSAMRVGWLGEPKGELASAAAIFHSKGYRLLLWPHSQGSPDKASEAVLSHYEIGPDYDFPHPTLLPEGKPQAAQRPLPPTQASLF